MDCARTVLPLVEVTCPAARKPVAASKGEQHPKEKQPLQWVALPSPLPSSMAPTAAPETQTSPLPNKEGSKLVNPEHCSRHIKSCHDCRVTMRQLSG